MVATAAEPGTAWRIGLKGQRLLLGLLALAALVLGLAMPFAAPHWRVELPFSLALGTGLIGGVVFALWLSTGRTEAFLARRLALPPGTAFPVCAAAIILGGYFGWQRLVIEDHFRSARRFAQQVLVEVPAGSRLAFYRDAPTNLVYYLGSNRPIPVLERLSDIDTFVSSEGGELVLLGTAGDIKRLSAELPAGVSSRIIAGESAFPWDAKDAAAPDRHLLLLIKERLPRRLIQMPYPPPAAENLTLSEPWDMEKQPWWGLRSLSDLHYDQSTQHLLVLSSRSKAIVEFTLDGVEVGRMSLKSGSAGLNRPAWSAEGITMSGDRTLYICGEEDELFVFKSQASGGSPPHA